MGDPLSEKSVGRALRTIAVLSTVALLVGGGPALAQDDPASVSPTETSTPTSTPPPSSEPAPAPAPAPAQKVEQQPSVSGVLYADANRNGQQDPGETISGGKVEIFGGDDSSKHQTTSDADGRFSFSGLAPGIYHPSYELVDGWVVHRTNHLGDPVTVDRERDGRADGARRAALLRAAQGHRGARP